MNKIKAFFMNKENRPKIIGIAVALAVVIVGIIVAVVVSMNIAQEKRTSVAGAIEIFTTVDGVPPASVMIAPASDKWWNNVLQYTSNRNLDNVKYGSIANGAKNIAYSTSKGGQYKSIGALGVPTTYVIYDTVDNASAAEKLMTAAGIQTYLYENVLVFITEGAFSDVDYTLASLKDKETNTIKPINLSEAKWTINFGNFKELYSATFAKPEDVLTFEAFTSSLGISNDTTWEGTSSDGLTWNGKVNNFNAGSVKTPQEIISLITSPTQKQLDKMKELTAKGTTKENEVSEDSFPLSSRVQRMLPSCCMNISNTETSLGSYIWDGVGVEGKKLDSGVFQMTFLINDFIALLAGNTAAYPISNFGLVQITLTDMNGSTKVVFTPAPEVDTVAPVTKNDPSGQNLDVVE